MIESGHITLITLITVTTSSLTPLSEIYVFVDAVACIIDALLLELDIGE